MTRVRTSVWFFLTLLVLGIIAVLVPLLYNLSQQLKPEQLAEARARWNERGLASYDLQYLERINGDKFGDVYEVKVRQGNVVELKVNDRLKALEALSAAERRQFTIPGLFDQIAERLAEETEGRKKNYIRAHFDPAFGFPVWYVHSIRATNSRLEWNVKLVPSEEAPGKGEP